MDLIQSTLAQSIKTQEAADTCASAAEPPAVDTRQAGEYTVRAAPAEEGQWQLIKNSAGEDAILAVQALPSQY
jgi:hypothetical protein